MATGTTLLGLLAGGVITLPGIPAASAAAQETATIAEVPAPAAASSEQIEVTPSESEKAADDEIKIETRPDGTIIIPAGRPQWVEGAPNLSGSVHTIAVASGHYKRPRDAQRALDQEIAEATNLYIADQLGSSLAPTLLGYETRTIKQRFVKPQNVYEETLTFPDPLEEMAQSHALLEFPQSFRDELEARWAKVRATSRLAQMGLFAGASLLLLASVFGYFRLDNATRGYYTGRLQFMAAAAILAIIGAGALAARWITWM
jgi:hypothetical protein